MGKSFTNPKKLVVVWTCVSIILTFETVTPKVFNDECNNYRTGNNHNNANCNISTSW